MLVKTRALIQAPTVDVVSVDEVKTLLGITGSDEDGLLEAAVAAVAATLDAASDGWLGRALRPQTWELRLSEFPAGRIDLPFPPVTEVTSIKYDDGNGTEQTLAAGTDYRVLGLAGHLPTSVAPAYGRSWPGARADFEAVRIRYVAGYASSGSDDAMPQAIKSAVALGVSHLRSVGGQNLFLRSRTVEGVGSREWVVSEMAGKVITGAMESLLSTYRVW